MADVRECERCGDQFERALGTNRRNCYKCSPARITAAGADPVKTLQIVTPIGDGPDMVVSNRGPASEATINQPHEPGAHERAVRAELAALGEEWLESIEGVGVIGLAFALDDQWLPGAQRTSMFKELKTTIDQIRLIATPKEVDTTDFWAERAMERARNAGNAS